AKASGNDPGRSSGREHIVAVCRKRGSLPATQCVLFERAQVLRSYVKVIRKLRLVDATLMESSEYQANELATQVSNLRVVVVAPISSSFGAFLSPLLCCAFMRRVHDPVSIGKLAK